MCKVIIVVCGQVVIADAPTRHAKRAPGIRERVVAVIIREARPMTAGELQRNCIRWHRQNSIGDACADAVAAGLLSVRRGKGRRPNQYAPPDYKWPDAA